MNREIKFRAWHIDNKEMVLWSTLKQSAFNYGECKLFYDVFVGKRPDYCLMQHSGQKDKDENEIYEGDIVNIKWETDSKGGYMQSSDAYCEHEVICVVRFDNMAFRFYQKDGKQFSKRNDSSICVIGNLFENPELIK